MICKLRVVKSHDLFAVSDCEWELVGKYQFVLDNHSPREFFFCFLLILSLGITLSSHFLMIFSLFSLSLFSLALSLFGKSINRGADPSYFHFTSRRRRGRLVFHFRLFLRFSYFFVLFFVFYFFCIVSFSIPLFALPLPRSLVHVPFS